MFFITATTLFVACNTEEDKLNATISKKTTHDVYGKFVSFANEKEMHATIEMLKGMDELSVQHWNNIRIYK